ncbi:uncharacterized protein LOC143223291 [Tachypleus tridentatus]|uniref:uncharacterized protein LOC143223291 n=1 Tax=Tachypleus tridentatus TaxID=6853 RepID=UPI003FD20A8A
MMEGRLKSLTFVLNFLSVLTTAIAMPHLESFSCPEKGLPMWKTPTERTSITDICNFVINVGTPAETTTSADASYDIIVYLSLSHDVETPTSSATKLGTIPVQYKSNTSIQVALDNIMVDPVEFCGDACFVAELQKTEGGQTEIISSMASLFQLECLNEEGVDLELIVQFANGTVINFASNDSFETSYKNFPLNYMDKPIKDQIPGGLKILVKNNGNTVFRQRSGMKILQTWAYIRAYNHEDVLPLGGEQTNPALLQYNVTDIIVHKANRLVNPTGNFTSNAIPPGGAIELDLTQLVLLSERQPHPHWESYLIIAVDPLKSTTDNNRKNNYFVLPMALECCGRYNSYCEVKGNIWKGGDKAWITYNPRYMNGIRVYEYMRDSKSLKKIQISTVLTDMTKMIWLERVTEVLADQMDREGMCPLEMKAHIDPILLMIGDLAKQLEENLKNSIKPDMSEWQQSQLNNMASLVSVVSQILEELVIPDRSLHKYLSEIVTTFQSVGSNDQYGPFSPDITMDTNDQQSSWSSMYSQNNEYSVDSSYVSSIPEYSSVELDPRSGYPSDMYKTPVDIISNLLENMINSSVPLSYVPESLRLIIQRLMLEGETEAKRLNPDMSYDLLKDLKKAIEMFLSKESIAPELIMPMIQTLTMTNLDISPEGEMIALNKIKALLAMVQGYKKNVTVGSKEEEMLEVWEATLETSLAGNFWNEWYRIAKELIKIRIMNEEWMLKEGEIGEYPTDTMCQMAALEKLMELKGFSESPFKLMKKTFYEVYDNAVFRGDRDPITGKLFWNQIMLCSCSDTYQCSRYPSYYPSYHYPSSSYNSVPSQVSLSEAYFNQGEYETFNLAAENMGTSFFEP